MIFNLSFLNEWLMLLRDLLYTLEHLNRQDDFLAVMHETELGHIMALNGPNFYLAFEAETLSEHDFCQIDDFVSACIKGVYGEVLI